MTRQTVAVVPVVALLLLAVAGCGAAPYAERMKFLDDMSKKGIEYRGQLYQQGTNPSEKACTTGFGLLQAHPPSDTPSGGMTPEWLAQVKEAYVKSCMTGAPRPKPDPSGIKAVTPVPVVSPMVSPSP